MQVKLEKNTLEIIIKILLTRGGPAVETLKIEILLMLIVYLIKYQRKIALAHIVHIALP